MKNRYAKTILALLLSIAMIVGLVPTAGAAELTEVPADSLSAVELTEVPAENEAAAEPQAVAAQADPEPAADAAAVEPAGNADAGSKARAASDPRVVSELTVTIGPMSINTPFPQSVYQARALDTNRQDVVEIAASTGQMELRWPRVPNSATAKPVYGAAYLAEITVIGPENVTFASSLGTTGLTLQTQSGTNTPTVVAENLQITSNVGNVLVITGTFTLGGIINSMTAKIAQPKAGAPAYEQPEDVTVHLDASSVDAYIPMTTTLAWGETCIQTSPVLNANGEPTNNFSTRVTTRTMSGSDVFKADHGEIYNGVPEFRYFYRPQLTVIARGTYSFSPSVDTHFQVLVNGINTSFGWKLSRDLYNSKQIVLTPDVDTDINNVQTLLKAENGENSIQKVYVALPQMDMTQGALVPTLSVNNNDLMRDVSATFNGRYMQLQLYEASGVRAVEWTAGVVNGRFDEKDHDGKAQLVIRTATPPGFMYSQNFTSDNIEASWKDGNGLGGTQSQDISRYAKKVTAPSGEVYLEFTLDIIIQPVQVTSIEDFDWDPEPAIGRDLKSVQFVSIPFRYGSNLQSAFPKLEKDYEATLRPSEIAGKAVLTWTKNGQTVTGPALNDALEFNDTLTAVITLHATDAFQFPERVSDASVDGGWRGPTTWRQPDGWVIDWTSWAADPNNQGQADNSTKQLTMRKTFVFPARIDTIDLIQMADLIVGEAGPQPAEIQATSKQVTSSWFNKAEETLTNEHLEAAATWSEAATMYGTTYDVSLVLTSKDPAKYAFDDKLDNALTDQVLSWPENESAVKPASVTIGDVTAVKGSGTMTVDLKVTVPRGVVRSFTASPGDLQLVAGRSRTKQIKVNLRGGAENNENNWGSAGIFAPEATLDADLVWELVNADNMPDKTNPLAIRGRDYLGTLNFTVSGAGQNYVLPEGQDAIAADILEIYKDSDTHTNVSSSVVTATHLVTTAKLPIDRVELKIAPPIRNLPLATLNAGQLNLETQATYYADSEAVATSEIELSGWWDGGTDRYAVNMEVKLKDEDFVKYCFGYGDEKFTWDQVDANVGEATSLSIFKILGEDYLDGNYDFSKDGMPGSGFTVTNYLIPASRAVDKVEVDIIPPWSASKPEVNARKTSESSDDYQVVTPQIRFAEGADGTYNGTLVVEARGAAGMDGGSVFRSEDGLHWDSLKLADAIQLNGMNDAVVEPNFDMARADSFQYADDKLVIPFTIRYATQQIQDTKVYVPRPILNVQPLDHVDLASALRTSRYKVTDTVWQRDAGAEAEDPFLATVTLEANREDPIREFDDEFYFPETFWNKDWTPEELASVVEPLDPGSDPENPVQPQSAEVVDGKLVLTLLVYPREVENEIQRLEMNIAIPTLSGAERGGETITQIAYYNMKTGSSGDPLYAPGSADVESVIPSEYITRSSWVRQANGKYRAQYTIRPDSEYTFLNRGGNIVSLRINEGPMPRNIEVTPAGTLTFEVECDLTDDIKLVVRTNPAGLESDVAVTPEVKAAWPNSQGKVDLKVQPRSGYSLLGNSSDLQMDDRVRVASGSDIHMTAGRGYVYSLSVAQNVTPENKAYITVNFTPNDIRLPRADGMTVTVNGAPYTLGTAVEGGSQVRVQLQNGYELRPGRVLELYDVLTDEKLETLQSTDGNRSFTFTMPDTPVEVYGRVVRPGEPDPDPTPRPSTRPSQDPPGPDDPWNPDDPTDPGASSDPSSAPTPSTVPSSPSTPKPSPTPSGIIGQDDYVKYGSLEDLQTIDGSPITLSGSGADKVIKGYQVKSGSSALVRDLAGQYWLPDGLEIQIVDAKGKVLKSSDKVATGHTLQLINSRKHVLDSAVVSLKGDVTGSGVIGISQLVRLAKAVTYEKPLEEPFFSAGDLNNNGRIDLGDMVQLATKIAGK